MCPSPRWAQLYEDDPLAAVNAVSAIDDRRVATTTAADQVHPAVGGIETIAPQAADQAVASAIVAELIVAGLTLDPVSAATTAQPVAAASSDQAVADTGRRAAGVEVSSSGHRPAVSFSPLFPRDRGTSGSPLGG